MDKQEELAQNVFSYIQQEKTAYETRGVPLASNWEWSMFKHIERSFLLKNSKFSKGNNDGKRPFKNIIIPIANVNYRTEGFDIKDIDLYVDDSDYHHLSLLARKYHAKWALEHSVDTAIDESVESYFDYGLGLVKNVNDKRPEIVPLQRLAFCDQTDILSGPICEKHDYSMDQLLDMKGKWYEDAIDDALLQAQTKKNVSLAKKDAKTPGKYIEVYELHGTFPKTWLNKEGEEDEYTEEDGYCPQIHIVTYYKNAQGKNSGICLFKGKESKPVYKALKRDPIFGRACGRGGIEELFEPQTWVNYSEIHLQKMLEATSKIILQTASQRLASENKISDIDNNQILVHDEGKPLSQVQIQPFNKAAFDNYVNAWDQNARAIGSASDPALGLNSKSGTPLGETQIITAQGQGIHEYRQGKISLFWGEIYRDWVLNYLKNDMNKGDRWLEELSLDELKEVAERVAISVSNERIKGAILSGKDVTPEQQQLLISIIKEEWVKGGKKRFMEIMKGEFEKLPLKVKFNIAGKHADLADRINKLNSIFRTVIANPAVLQSQGMGELFNQIIESTGMSPINFTSLTATQEQPMPGAVPSPMQEELVPTA